MAAAPEEKSVESRSHMEHPASQGPTPQRNCPVAGATYALHRRAGSQCCSRNPRSLRIAAAGRRVHYWRAHYCVIYRPLVLEVRRTNTPRFASLFGPTSVRHLTETTRPSEHWRTGAGCGCRVTRLCGVVVVLPVKLPTRLWPSKGEGVLLEGEYKCETRPAKEGWFCPQQRSPKGADTPPPRQDPPLLLFFFLSLIIPSS